MSRDRLKDIRANSRQGGGAPQQQQQQYNNNSNDDGYGQQQQQNYAPPPSNQQQYSSNAPPQQQQEQYQQYAQQGGNNAYQQQQQQNQGYNGSGNNAPRDVMGSFFAEVESIQDDLKSLQSNINSVSELHSRRLATTDDVQQANQTAQLTQLTSQTSQLTNTIRNRITTLNDTNKRSKQGDVDFKVRKTQIGALQNGFRKALEEYNAVEKRSRDKYRQRMERQIKIVKPDASQQEIRAAFEDNSGGQVFAQALVQSRQQGARAAFAEIQTRNQDLRKIEETITQLAQMMQDMATLVLEQDDAVISIENNAVATHNDMSSGLEQTQKAVKSARAARKKRWICFFILLAIAIVLAAVLAIEIPKMMGH